MKELGFCPRPVNSRPPGPLAAAECIAAAECGCDIGYPVPWLQFELPTPASCNQFIRKLGNKTPAIRNWARRADMAFMSFPVELRRSLRCKIIGPFEAEFLFGRDESDFHNREKVLFDWLQSREFIVNDKLCEWRSSGWSDDVPKGRVVVRLRPWMEAK